MCMAHSLAPSLFPLQVPFTCAWAAVELSGIGWLNATIAVRGRGLVLTVPVRGGVVGSAYGWGAIPMLTVYDASSSLPVLPWNTSWNISYTSGAGS